MAAPVAWPCPDTPPSPVLDTRHEAPGGAAGTAVNVIDNHFGFPDGIAAGSLAQRGLRQALNMKVEWLPACRAESLSTLEDRDAGDGQPPLRRPQVTARTTTAGRSS
ncbi:hypothetical protein ABZV75_32825 [Streptomyces flaveolus]|uniref:hypothetical protein n=1 Tax=Streptomyces flaveolus TaxID=67297 RepID=UPI0033A50C53